MLQDPRVSNIFDKGGSMLGGEETLLTDVGVSFL